MPNAPSTLYSNPSDLTSRRYRAATVTTPTQVTIVSARKEHAPFIAWVELTAARSHLERGLWDLYIDSTEVDCLRFLEALANTDVRHFAHYSKFLVAEVDGRPAAALCGYFEEEDGMPAIAQGIAEANGKLGRTSEADAEGWRRAGAFLRCAPEHSPRTWIVEWVATSPEYRRRGVVELLMAEVLEVGRKMGASTADIGVMIGNDPAQRAYEKAGFAVVAEKRDQEFESVYHSPGIRQLRRSI